MSVLEIQSRGNMKLENIEPGIWKRAKRGGEMDAKSDKTESRNGSR